jgi:hypothetical protein
MEKYTKKKYLIALFFVLGVIAVLTSARITGVCAQGLWDIQQGREEIADVYHSDPKNPTDLRVVAVNGIKLFLTFVRIILLIYILVAGFKWMTAAGNQDRVSEARKQIGNAVIGIIIILAAYVITSFLTTCVFQIIADDPWFCFD